MPQLSKISQRRLLLDQFCDKILTMPSTESERCRPLILMPSKKWSAYHRNRWSAWFRTSGRHPSESMVGMTRIMHSCAHADGVRLCLGQLMNPETPVSPIDLVRWPELLAVGTQQPDLQCYDQLLERV